MNHSSLASIGLALASAGYAATMSGNYPGKKAAIVAHDTMVSYESANGGPFKAVRVYNAAQQVARTCVDVTCVSQDGTHHTTWAPVSTFQDAFSLYAPEWP